MAQPRCKTEDFLGAKNHLLVYLLGWFEFGGFFKSAEQMGSFSENARMVGAKGSRGAAGSTSEGGWESLEAAGGAATPLCKPVI